MIRAAAPAALLYAVVYYPDFPPKRFIGWGLIAMGGVAAAAGWLWILSAARRGMVIGRVGWRGAVAICLLVLGVVIIWQSVPLAFAI